MNRSLLLHSGLSHFKCELEACIVATRGCIYNYAFCGSAFRMGGRAQFNFESGNYSDCDDDVLTDFIVRTLALND